MAGVKGLSTRKLSQVDNQEPILLHAVDRAYRIPRKRSVLFHRYRHAVLDMVLPHYRRLVIPRIVKSGIYRPDKWISAGRF
jgi:hypothetical protein